MITKAIIEGVEPLQVNGEVIQEYTVRLPIFHGYGSSDITPTRELPKAIYCSPPHMEKTQFCKGDIVYVAIEDFDLSQIVILGMIPVATERSLYGSVQTQSKITAEKVGTFLCDREGTVELPFDIKVFTTKNENIVTSGKDFVDGTEISYLKDTTAPIQKQLDGVKESLITVAQRFYIEAKINSTSNGFSFINLNNDVWVSSSGLLDIDFVYQFTLRNNIWSVRNKSGVLITFTRDELEKLCGITYQGSGTIINVIVSMSPLSVMYGGTGADNSKDALKNLGTFQNRLVSESEFNNMSSNSLLETDTVYFIYS